MSEKKNANDNGPCGLVPVGILLDAIHILEELLQRGTVVESIEDDLQVGPGIIRDTLAQLTASLNEVEPE